MASARVSLDNVESNPNIEKAKNIVNRFNASPLYIVEVRKEYDQKIAEFTEAGSLLSSSSKQRPRDVSFELDSHLTFLRKLKFHFLEQDAKDKYIKTIVKDESDIISIEDNETLRKANEAKKALLKQTKESLAQRYKDIQSSAVNVESQYKKAEALVNEFGSLTSQILDARLALSRLRTSFPAPRLSVASAKATLESQTDTMAALDTQLSDNAARVDKLKESIQEAAMEVERTRVERATKEEEARQSKAEENDGRIAGLYDWFTASLALHRSLLSLVSWKSQSENELSLTYDLGGHERDEKSRSSTFTLSLLFHPNTRTLADASISSPDNRITSIDFNDLIDNHIQSNDIAQLIRSIMARVRVALGSN